VSEAEPLPTGDHGVLLSVAYLGAEFSGWAPQPGRRTVAGELLGALRTIDPRIAQVRGSSRTDAGVHAHDQRVAFDPSRDLPLGAWLHGAQRNLPPSVSILRAWQVARGYDPRAHGRSKTYRYLLATDERRDPFVDGRAWRVPELASAEAVELARLELEQVVGEHDFAAFRSAADARERTVRTISSASLEPDPSSEHLLRLEVRGTGFMHNMVRIVVGTVVDVARRRLARGAIARGLDSRDRRTLGITAPPEGLYLWRTELADDDTRA
jgi:tRNA pseudouridine38-40 synthase